MPSRLKWPAKRGTVSMEVLSPTVILFELVGHLDIETSELLLAALDERLQHAPRAMNLFWDMEKLDGYDSEFRLRAVSLLRKRWDKIASIHAFTRSKIVKMGVAVANLALDNSVHVHASRIAFDAALAKALIT